MQISDIQPVALWQHFAALNAVPRPSGDEGRVREFIKQFAADLHLECKEDKVGNIVIKKPATKGMEKRPTLVLQAHLDMVHEANADTKFDFNTQGIDMYIDGDWVKARGTTLGADNGIGVAAIMGLLASKDMQHPALEALFTIDEERGLTGALNLEKGLLKGKTLLNLDTEEDHVFSIGCAGGLDSVITWQYKSIATPEGATGLTISLSGLRGGHSGMDINKGWGNAHKLMNRVLLACQSAGLGVCTLTGGSKRNAIPRESTAWVSVKNMKKFEKLFGAIEQEIWAEYQTIEPELNIAFAAADAPKMVMQPKDQKRFLLAMRAAHNGVLRMSPDIAGLVETSSNLAKITLGDGQAKIETLQRSSVESGKMDVATAVSAPFELIGAKVDRFGSYPGWKPNPSSKILDKLVRTYENLFQEKPVVEACHAGLECGIIGGRYPGMDMVSFGPNIYGAHSPTERVSISSVQKFWTLFTKVVAEF